ncbi:hypothetical protein NX059_011097 [Plenodomus lindquistii]|nr:hypothetical protein NX059_011097 [Plenodomus lindquistii]
MASRLPSTATAELPNDIALEVPYTVTFDSLPKQSTKTTPVSPGSQIRTIPPTSVSSRIAAVGVGRVIAAHHGHLPDDFKDIIDGIPGTPAAAVSLSQHWNSVFRDLFYEKYGPSSFLRAYIKGKACTEDFRIMMMNHKILAHLHSIVPADATAIQMHTEAQQKMRQMWNDAYTRAYQATMTKMATEKGIALVRSRRVLALYDGLKAAVPGDDFVVQNLNTKRHCEAALRQPIGQRDRGVRLQFWTSILNNDAISSFFDKSTGVVDVRRLVVNSAQDTAAGQGSVYPDMWRDKLRVICDDLYMHIIAMDEDIAAKRVFSSDIQVRNSTEKSHNLTTVAYNNIRGLHVSMGFDEDIDCWGTWHDVPIIRHIKAGGRKRKAETDIGGRGASRADIVDDEALGL